VTARTDTASEWTRRTPDARGRQARTPTQIPARGWKDVLVRTAAECKADNISLLAGAVAFFALLAIVPALIVAVTVYGLVADPTDIARHVSDVLGSAPEEARNLVVSQLRGIAARDSAAGLRLVLGTLLALWSASSGIQHAINATNLAYDEQETRGYVRMRALSLAFTVGAVLFGLAAVVLISVLPAALAGTALGTAARIAIGILRWPLLALALLLCLSVFYRYAPDRDDPQWLWVTPGALVATGLWLVASIGFAIYTANFGSYNETYGSLGAVVILMLWLFITALVVIAGAELNAELERQTVKDTTEGRPLPLGARGAYAADTVGPTAEEMKRSRTAKAAEPADAQNSRSSARSSPRSSS
jgi:membrane protein